MKNKLKKMKEYLQDREGWDLGELIDEMAYETGKLKSKTDFDFGMNLDTDECSIICGTLKENPIEICDLDEFITSYTEIFIEKICNVIDSFDDEVVHLSKTEIKELIKEADELAKSDEGEVSFDELFGEDE